MFFQGGWCSICWMSIIGALGVFQVHHFALLSLLLLCFLFFLYSIAYLTNAIFYCFDVLCAASMFWSYETSNQSKKKRLHKLWGSSVYFCLNVTHMRTCKCILSHRHTFQEEQWKVKGYGDRTKF